MRALSFTLLFFIAVCLISSCSKSNTNHGSPGPGSGCDTPIVEYVFVSSNMATLPWQPMSGIISWKIEYGKVGTNVWDTSLVPGADTLVFLPLDSNTTYQWRIQSICASGSSPFTVWHTFKTTSPMYTTYRGAVHVFNGTLELIGSSQSNYTFLQGNPQDTTSITLFQVGIGSATASFACDPTQVNNILTLTIGASRYQNTTYSSGSEVRTIINSNTCIVTFNCTVYNEINPSDSIVITNGSYSGACFIQ